MAMTISGTSGVTFPSTAVQGDAAQGYGQTWQNVAASRASGTTYTNSTGKPIMVSFASGWSPANNINVYVNGVQIYTWGIVNNQYVQTGFAFTVPNGNTYSITSPGGFGFWAELR